MSEKEKAVFDAMTTKVNHLTDSGYEGTILAITASYLAGKEAGKREAQKSDSTGA